MTAKKSNLEKYNKQILEEVNYCWNKKENVTDMETEQITLKDVLKNDKDIFLKNIVWVDNGKDIYPYYYINIDNTEKVLINFPYTEISIKAYRNGDYFYQNQSLKIIN